MLSKQYLKKNKTKKERKRTMQRLITPAGLFSLSAPPPVDRFLAPNRCELAFLVAFMSDTQNVHFSSPVGSRRRRFGLHLGSVGPQAHKADFQDYRLYIPERQNTSVGFKKKKKDKEINNLEKWHHFVPCSGFNPVWS